MPNLVKKWQRPIHNWLKALRPKHGQDYLRHAATDGYKIPHALKQPNEKS